MISNDVISIISKYAPKEGLILDLGCGDFSYTEFIKGKNKNVISIDINNYSFVQSKNNNFILGSLETLPFKDNSFDFIICLSVIQYFKNDSNINRDLNRILKPEGILLITVPTGLSPFRLLRDLAIKLGVYEHPQYYLSRYHYYTNNDIIRLSNESKLIDIYGYEYNFIPRFIDLLLLFLINKNYFNNTICKLVKLKKDLRKEEPGYDDILLHDTRSMPIFLKIGQRIRFMRDISYHYVLVFRKHL